MNTPRVFVVIDWDESIAFQVVLVPGRQASIEAWRLTTNASRLRQHYSGARRGCSIASRSTSTSPSHTFRK
jgi:hypothetical protein